MADYLKKASLRRANAMPDLTKQFGKSPDSQKTEIEQDLFADTLRRLNLSCDTSVASLKVLHMCDTVPWPSSPRLDEEPESQGLVCEV